MRKNNKYLIVGLGNPGSKYERTRHNVGFGAIDLLKKKWGVTSFKKRFNGELSVVKKDNDKIFILKPTTFMNNSGQSIKGVAKFHRIDVENIVVIYDDMDIKVGSLRMRIKGSGGSHNGMKSIIAHIKSYDFPRIRIGIGKPAKGEDTIGFVLGRATGEDAAKINNCIEDAVGAIECYLKDGIETAMQKYNK